MKIFFDHKIFVNQKYGGPSRYFANLVKELNFLDSTTAKIFAPLHINNYLNNLNKNNIGFSNKFLFQERFAKSPRLNKKLMGLNNYLNKFFFSTFKPDIFHTTYYNKDFIANKKKLVVTVFDLIHEIYRKEYNFSKQYLPKKEILNSAEHIICISNSTKNDLMKYYDIPEKKISVTYLATDFKLIDNQPVLKEKYFLYVGSRWKYKNFSALLEVLGYDKNILQNFKLVIFGGGKLSTEEIELINKYNIDKTKIIHFEGDDNLLKSLYKKQNMRVLVFHYWKVFLKNVLFFVVIHLH